MEYILQIAFTFDSLQYMGPTFDAQGLGFSNDFTSW